MIKLLLVEDEYNFAYTIQGMLQNLIGGYEIVLARNGKDGLKKWKSFNPDIIVSDVDMPIMDGYKMVELIRELDGDVPILFISGLSSSKNVLTGYKVGINSYIKKPFLPEELDAHVKAILKMKGNEKFRSKTDCYHIGHFTFVPKSGVLHNNRLGTDIIMTKLHADLLHLLVKNKDEIILKNDILDLYWNNENESYAKDRLYVHISYLRKYLKDDSNIQIKSLNSIGYTLTINTTLSTSLDG